MTTAGESGARVVPLDGSALQTLGGFDAAGGARGGGTGRKAGCGARAAGGQEMIRCGTSLPRHQRGRPRGPARLARLRVPNVEFDADGQMLVAEQDRLMRVDPATGRRMVLAEDVGKFTLARQGEVVLSRRPADTWPNVATVHDLVAGTHIPLPGSRAGSQVRRPRHPGGAVAVTGDRDGVVRVGPVSGVQPHWLVGHEGSVRAVAMSPDGRTIASGGRDGTIRLWPMPDLGRPPLHTLPRAELVAHLRSLTNLRVVCDPDDPGSYVVEAEHFPGWHTVPEW